MRTAARRRSPRMGGSTGDGDAGAPTNARNLMENHLMSHHSAEHRSTEMNQCITDCFNCAAICIETINHCLSMGGEHASADHIGLMQTCAEICTVSANAMLRGTHAHSATCRACAEICRLCAESCERIGGQDEAMRRCIDACRRCERSCAAMASM